MFFWWLIAVLIARVRSESSSATYWSATVSAIRDAGGVVSAKLTHSSSAASERGVRAAEDIAAGELLLSVPDALVLRRSDVIGSERVLNGSSLSAYGALTLHLLRLSSAAADAQASWSARERALMARLAAAAPCASCAFSVTASKHLSYASGEHLKRVRAQYRVDRATIAHRFGVAAAPAAADRVYCYVLSHALQLSALERPELAPFPDVLATFPSDYAVVPGFDLFGHSMRDNTVTSLENGHWTVRTRLAYSAGTPVTIRYGSLANVQLLMQYGFVLDANPYDVLHLTVAPFPQDVNAAFKQKLIDERFGAFAERRFARGGAVGVNRTAVPVGLIAQALASLRLVVLQPELVSSIIVGRIFSGQPAGPLLSEANAQLALYRGCEALAQVNRPAPDAQAKRDDATAVASLKMRKQEFELAKQCERSAYNAVLALQMKLDERISGGMSAERAGALAI